MAGRPGLDASESRLVRSPTNLVGRPTRLDGKFIEPGRATVESRRAGRLTRLAALGTLS